jgi:predicted RNase H-like HicB family nuclease
MIKFRVKLLVERDGEGYHVYCPDLPGLHVGADTEEEVKALALDAAVAYLSSLLKHGDPIPLSVAEIDWTFLWATVKGVVLPGSTKPLVADISVPVPA